MDRERNLAERLINLNLQLTSDFVKLLDQFPNKYRPLFEEIYKFLNEIVTHPNNYLHKNAIILLNVLQVAHTILS